MRLISLNDDPDYLPDIEFKFPWRDRLPVTLSL